MLIICNNYKHCHKHRFDCVFYNPQNYAHLDRNLKNIIDTKSYFCFVQNKYVNFVHTKEIKND